MTPREQVIVVLFLVLFGGFGLLVFLDWAHEQISEHLAREATWRQIEMRCSRERHPSSQVQLFDQDAQHG